MVVLEGARLLCVVTARMYAVRVHAVHKGVEIDMFGGF